MPFDIYAAIAAWVRAEAIRQPLPPTPSPEPAVPVEPASPAGADDAPTAIQPPPDADRLTRRCQLARLIHGMASALRRSAVAVTAGRRRKR
ncbi:hypothetical protein GCM10009753_02240 [Streptantibioticus ferralitis]